MMLEKDRTNGFNRNRVEDAQETKINPLRELVVDKIRSEEYASLMDPIVQKITEGDAGSINEAFLYWGDYQIGYRETISLLANILDIEEPHLDLHVVPKLERIKYPYAQYSDRQSAIRVFHTEDDSYVGTGKIMAPIRKIAHEMWHAYQFNEIRKHGPRSIIYQDGFNQYYRPPDKPTIEEYERYIKQPVEEEAFVFGEKFVLEFVKKLIKDSTNELANQKHSSIGRAALENAFHEGHIDERDYSFELENIEKVEQLGEIKKLYTSMREDYNLDND